MSKLLCSQCDKNRIDVTPACGIIRWPFNANLNLHSQVFVKQDHIFPPNHLPNLFFYMCHVKTLQGVPLSGCIYGGKHAKRGFVNVVWIRLPTVMKMTSCWYKSFNGYNNSLVKTVILLSWKDVPNKKNMTFRSEGEKRSSLRNNGDFLFLGQYLPLKKTPQNRRVYYED